MSKTIRHLLLLAYLPFVTASCGSEPSNAEATETDGGADAGPDASMTVCQNRDWSFEILDDRSLAGYGASIVIDASGGTTIASARSTGLAGDIVIAERRSGETWQVADLTNTGTHAPYTDMLIDDNGVVHLAFHDVLDGFLRHAHRTSSDAWQIDDIKDTVSVGGIPSIAPDGAGVAIAHVDLQSAISDPFDLRLTRIAPGAPPDTSIVDTRTASPWGILGLDLIRVSDGFALVYPYSDGSGNSKYDLSFLRRHDDGVVELSFIEPLSEQTVPESPKLVALSEGRFVAVYSAYGPEGGVDPTVGGVWRAVSQDGITWTKELMAPIGPCELDVALVGGEQVVVVATSHGVKQAERLHILSGPADGAWDHQEVPVSVGVALRPAIAMDAEGTVRVPFMAYSAGDTHLAYGEGRCRE